MRKRGGWTPHDPGGAPGHAGPRMSAPEPIHVRCDLVPSEPIRGRLTDDQGTTIDFEGWTQLAAVLGALIDAAPTAGHDQRSTHE